MSTEPQYLYWSKPSEKSKDWMNGGIIDLGLAEGELIQGMTALNGKLYVFTQHRTFAIVPKSRLRKLFERGCNLLRKLRLRK